MDPDDGVLAHVLSEIRTDFPSLLPEDSMTPLLCPSDHQVFKRLNLQSTMTLHFSPFPVELLLQEAQELLARCLVNREAKLELEVKLLDFWFSYRLSKKKEEIKRKQIDAGELQLPSTLADIDYTLYNTVDSMLQSALVAQINGRAMREPDSEDYKAHVSAYANLTTKTSPHSAPDIRPTAVELIQSTLKYEGVAAAAEEMRSRSSVTANASQKDMALERKNFESQNVQLKKDLFAMEVEDTELRATAATAPGVGLNYAERVAKLQQLFDVDFLDAYRRLKAAEAGLETIFGFDDKLPLLENDGAVNDLTIWNRTISSKLNSLLTDELTFTMDVAVEQLMGEGQWKEALKAGNTSFEIPLTVFSDFKLIRLKSIRLFSRSNETNGSWKVHLRLPDQGQVIKIDGSTTVIEQTKLPRLAFFDINRRNPINTSGRVTSRGIVNASPIGKWILYIAEVSSLGEPRAKLTGLDLSCELSALTR